MKLFVPFFVVFASLAFAFIYSAKFRALAKKHGGKVAITLFSVAIGLLLMFSGMSFLTWRLF